jgi:hypothetical protein
MQLSFGDVPLSLNCEYFSMLLLLLDVFLSRDTSPSLSLLGHELRRGAKMFRAAGLRSEQWRGFVCSSPEFIFVA